MTPKDRDEFRAVVREGIRQGSAALKAETIAQPEAPDPGGAESDKVHTDSPDRTFREATHEIQAKWRLGLDRISLDYSRRFDAIEAVQVETNSRLAKLEERVLAVELRVPPAPRQRRSRHGSPPGMVKIKPCPSRACS
jgi:BMFP domain-containing protein YqiC